MIRRDTAHSLFLYFVFLLMIPVGACGPDSEKPVELTSEIAFTEIQPDDAEVQDAITEARLLVEAAPLDPNTWFQLGRRLQANGFDAPALDAYERVLELQSGHRQATYLKAVVQHGAGRPQDAVLTLGSLSESGATDAAMERALALWYLELGDAVSAEAAAARALELEQNSRGGHALLARSFIESGRPGLACAELKPLVERPIRHSYIDFLYATALMADGRLAEAQEMMPGTEPTPPLWPDPHVEALNELVAGYPAALEETRGWLSSGEVDQALKRSEELHQRNPESVGATLLWALCLRDSGRLEQAMDVLMTALDRRPRHPELLYQAAAVLTMAAQTTGDDTYFPTALALAEAAIEIGPDRFEGYGVAGAVLLSMGRLDEALAAFQRCAEIDAFSPAHCSTKAGNVMIMLGRVDEGLAVLQEAVESQPLEAGPTVSYAVQLAAAGRQVELDALMDRLEAGGSVSADLLGMVEEALASGERIEPPGVPAGVSD